MKKAFTLIELLVVIAIIAILAAILFPVFAQAKVAAKKSVSISNLKQQNLSLFMYSGDYDDQYPHNDDCVVNSSLDPKYNGFVGTPTQADLNAHCNAFNTLGGFSWRVNHYAWQKWVQPYVKSVNLFYHPTIALLKGTNTTNGVPTGFDQGEIANGYALNIAITGAQNTWNQAGPPYTNVAAIRNSFVGGTQTGIADPAAALIMTEQWFQPVTGGFEVPSSGPVVTYYPVASKEHWAAMFYKVNATTGDPNNCRAIMGQIDSTKVPFGVVPVGFADGHVKALPVGDFLAKTPTYTQFTGAAYSSTICNPTAAYYNSAVTAINAGSWPLWGLQ